MYSYSPGIPEKLGVTFTKAGANFCVYARLAESVELLYRRYGEYWYAINFQRYRRYLQL